MLGPDRPGVGIAKTIWHMSRQKKNRARMFGSKRPKPLAGVLEPERAIKDPREDRRSAWKWIDAGMESEMLTPPPFHA
jgi:hypothetical protein